MHTNLKLFVWRDFCPDWSGGLAVALARDETEARKMIIKQYGFEPGNWGKLEVRRLDHRFAAYVSGGS
jgi:hypothetical protein